MNLDSIKQQRAVRIEICKSCPNLAKLLGGTCKNCGCNVLAKTWLPNEKCPINKWEEMK